MLLYAHVYCYDDFRQSKLIGGVPTAWFRVVGWLLGITQCPGRWWRSYQDQEAFLEALLDLEFILH